MRVLSLFSGIGGLDIAAEWAGMEVAAFCEIEPYAVKVLQRRWPDVPIFGDVFDLTADTLTERGIRTDGIDCIIGGFPCQPFSVAGKRKGAEDERFLWGQFSRLIEEIRPGWVVAENVPGIIGIALDDVLADLEGRGYGCLPFVYPASAVGAPHRRERVFIVAYRHEPGLEGRVGEELPGSAKSKQQGLSNKVKEIETQNWPTPSVSGNHNRRGLSEKSGDGLATAVQNWPTPHANCSTGAGKHGEGGENLQTAVGASLNPDWVEILMGFDIGWTDIYCDEPVQWPGWPAMMRVDQHSYEPPRAIRGGKNRAKRLKALGNSVVPQQAYPIFRAIMEVECNG